MSVDLPRIPQFRRVCSINVDGLDISALRVSFKVEKDVYASPNRAHIKVYNLAESTRRGFQQNDVQRLRLMAGYQGAVETIFDGDITRVESAREGQDWVTDFSVGDGVKKKRSKRAALSLRAATEDSALNRLLDAYGEGKGNFAQAVGALAKQGKVPQTLAKTVLTGNVADNIERLARDRGLTFSVQDRQPTFIALGKNTDIDIVKLTPTSGLLGSPELSKKGYIKIRALIQQKFMPGKCLEIRAQAFSGYVQIHKTSYEGDTRAGAEAWWADLECVQIPGAL